MIIILVLHDWHYQFYTINGSTGNKAQLLKFETHWELIFPSCDLTLIKICFHEEIVWTFIFVHCITKLIKIANIYIFDQYSFYNMTIKLNKSVHHFFRILPRPKCFNITFYFLQSRYCQAHLVFNTSQYNFWHFSLQLQSS